MEEKKYEVKDFEFTLLMNEKIIVNRNFDIIGYNPKAINSMNYKDGIDFVMDLIKEDLRKKSISYMLENLPEFYNDPKRDSNDQKDVITFKLTHLGKVIGLRVLDATIYPAHIRYTVNIREHIYSIIIKIQKTLSSKYLNTKYLGYELS